MKSCSKFFAREVFLSNEQAQTIDVSHDLVTAIQSFPLVRELEHCGQSFAVSPFAIYATCPHCGTEWKVRGFSSHAEVEDVFDAVFEWLTQPQATKLLRQRQREIEADRD